MSDANYIEILQNYRRESLKDCFLVMRAAGKSQASTLTEENVAVKQALFNLTDALWRLKQERACYGCQLVVQCSIGVYQVVSTDIFSLPGESIPFGVGVEYAAVEFLTSLPLAVNAVDFSHLEPPSITRNQNGQYRRDDGQTWKHLAETMDGVS